MSYELHSTARPFLDLVRSHAEPYSTKVLGTKIVVYPGVMSPKYDWTSTFIAKSLPDLDGKDVLEIGSGSGVLSLFAALQGAQSVLAVDINPIAIENTRANFEKYGLRAGYVALESDLFSAVPVDSKFDFVIFNAPFHGTEPSDDLERSISDFKYQLSKRFFEEANQYLKEGGRLLYAFGSMGDLALVKSFWEAKGFVVEEVVEDRQSSYEIAQIEDWTCYLFTLKNCAS